MEWEIRVPQVWRSMYGSLSSTKALCATTDKGEYVIQDNRRGKFGVLLDGVDLTGLVFVSARDAQQAAEKEEGFRTSVDRKIDERLTKLEAHVKQELEIIHRALQALPKDLTNDYMKEIYEGTQIQSVEEIEPTQ